MKRDRGPWIRTFTGRKFYLFDPRYTDIAIEDIAHSLAHTSRFGGHLPHFYSVAEHSILVASLVPDPHKLEALLHDAAEAYIGDIVRPLKYAVPDIKGIEVYISGVIRDKFNIPSWTPVVKAADEAMIAAEVEQLWQVDWRNEEGWMISHVNETPHVQFHCYAPHVAEQVFLEVFKHVSKP